MTDAAVLELVTNSLKTQMTEIRRRTFLQQHGLDAKRPRAWCEFGWPDDISDEQLYQAWDRQGIAFGAIQSLSEKCFETSPDVINGAKTDTDDKVTPWETYFNSTAEDVELWTNLEIAYARRMVHGWSAVLLRYADKGKWDSSVQNGVRLVEVIPIWKTDLKPGEPDTAENSLTYGQPKTWVCQYNTPLGKQSITVHPDRIFIIGDWTGNKTRSYLRAPYNNFINLEKIQGGSGESFLKNAARQLAINFDKEVDLDQIAKAHGVKRDEVKQIFNSLAAEINRGNDSILALQGADVKPLVATVTDPASHQAVNIESIAAALRIPVKVLVGMQTGERASEEDLKQFAARAQGLRTRDLSPIIKKLINKLIQLKVFKAEPFSVTWDDLTDASRSSKMDIALKMADANSKQRGSGEQPIYSNDEIRAVTGHVAQEEPAGGGE